MHPGMPLGVVFPTSTADVSTIMRLATSTGCRSCRAARARGYRAVPSRSKAP